MRRITTAAAVIAGAALVLTGCANEGPTAAELARQACGTTGTPGHTTLVPNGQGITAANGKGLAEDADRRAGVAAKAAVQDPRWDSLSAAMSKFASMTAQAYAQAQQTGQPTLFADQTAAWQAVETIYAECRKAHAAP